MPCCPSCQGVNPTRTTDCFRCGASLEPLAAATRALPDDAKDVSLRYLALGIGLALIAAALGAAVIVLG